jgi:hypothetical protein
MVAVVPSGIGLPLIGMMSRWPTIIPGLLCDCVAHGKAHDLTPCLTKTLCAHRI